jgi:2-polyprenyl-3-methyl-5-hydroxy-6-metoxy-1,4-benzoquinol methylase
VIALALRKLRSLRSQRQTQDGHTGQEVHRKFASPAERIRMTGLFTLDDVDLVTRTRMQHGMVQGTPWDDFRAANMVLPDWFDATLDPYSQEYNAQQLRLWAVLSRREHSYRPEVDEQQPPHEEVDAIRRPACYRHRDNDAIPVAGDHTIATGMILKHSGLKPGQRALEYGAGWAQAALALARMGVEVDTVDISSMFCDFVRRQAEFFQVPLTPFEGRFGCNPRGERKYDLILFYEAFHHCAEFRTVVHDLKRHLAPGGRVLLMGEPISRSRNRYLPYPWGLRLDCDPIAHVRHFGWLELGFTEDFLVELFTNAGFTAERVDCAPSIFGSGYIFRHRDATIELKKHWLTDEHELGWNSREDIGRWTKAEGRLYLDTTDSFQTLEIEASNRHPFPQTAVFEYGEAVATVRFGIGEEKTVRLNATSKASQLVIRAKARVPADNRLLPSSDTRPLGILIRSVTYQT